MHDKNGKPIDVGDFVKVRTFVRGEQRTIVAQIISTAPAATSCNIYLAVPYPAFAIREEYANAKDVERVEV